MSASPFRQTGTPLVATLLLAALAAAFAGIQIIEFIKTPADAAHRLADVVFLNATLPRMATALLCGAALSLAGTLLQLALRNPLADPTTLGISAGANLALVLATLYAPALLGHGSDLVALTGSVASAAVVFLLGARRGFSPVSLVLAGMVVSLWCGGFSSVLVLMNDRYLASLFIWGSGSLAMQSWDIPLSLLPKLACAGILAGLILRPIGLLELGDAGAAALGTRTGHVRFLAAALAIALAAFVTSAVGVIGFVGLVAPAIARLTGARRAKELFVWSTLIGACLLWMVDGAVQILAGATSEFLPTGAVTAVFGSPLLLFLLPRLRIRQRLTEALAHRAFLTDPSRISLVAFAIVPFLILVGSLLIGRSASGSWSLLDFSQWQSILPLRLPRVFAAFAAGSMLACAGAVLQRLTGNEMASPEVLGVSAGATAGMTAAVFLFTAPALSLQLGFASLGAMLVLVCIALLGIRSGFAPERVLLAGIALSAMLDAVISVLTASGDPRALTLMRWMSGSTYNVDGGTAALVSLAAVLLVSTTLLARRWLDIIPLGQVASQAVGMPISTARPALYGLCALLSAAATLTVGPLSFVGLMAPHLAREAGARRATPHLFFSALFGGGLMMLADWLGRMLIFPYQIPAGLVSALIGAPFLVLLIGRRPKTG